MDFVQVQQKHFANYYQFTFRKKMISLRITSQTQPDPEGAKGNRRQVKLPKQALHYTTDQPFELNHEHLAPRTEQLRAPHTNPSTEEEEKPKTPFKLPQINKKTSDNFSDNNDLPNPKDNQLYPDEPNTVHSNPFVRKYVDRKSSQKMKSEEAVNFLSIVGVKPSLRSASRISGKQTSNLAYDKINKPLPLKEDTNNRNHDNEHSASEMRTKKRRISTNLNCKSTTSQKIESVSRPKKNSAAHSTEKKRSVALLRLQKPKQSPSYYEWCLFLSILNGVISEKESGPTYKAFVGKGNNSILIKNVIKSRPWWILSQQNADINFVWTQVKNPKFLENLKEGPGQSPLEWEKAIKARMYLLSQVENTNQKSKQQMGSYLGTGFHKLLTPSQRQVFTKSPISANIYYPKQYRTFESTKVRMHNHLEFHWNLSNKKALYYNMKAYYLATNQKPFDNIPETYHVQKEGDEEWNNFIASHTSKSLWIVKPGENSNQGCGIDVVEGLDDVKQIVRNKSTRANGKPRSHIIQRYLMPFLYNKRKFDIRCFILVTSINGNLRCYWYEQGYVRTASKQFTTKNLKNRMIHLTNDAVQKHSQNYGKHENGNKLSFADFHKYVKNNRPDHDFYEESYPRMVQQAADAMRASHLVIDAKHREFSFELFGLDYMLDEHFNTWLIEVNTNPCLELSCPLLARLVPSMLENAFRVGVDPLFPPPKDYPKHKSLPEDSFQLNRFGLIFSSREQSDLSQVLQPSRLHDIVQSDEQSDCQKFQ